MFYKVIFPVVQVIDSDSFINAVKIFAKTNRDINISRLIMYDNNKYMSVKLKKFSQDGRNKIGIDMYPVQYNHLTPPIVPKKFIPHNIVIPPRYPNLLSPTPLMISPASNVIKTSLPYI